MSFRTSRTLLALATLTLTATAQEPATLVKPALAMPGLAAPAAPAAGLELEDLDGVRHALADRDGRVTVLEWTSHFCPAVQAVQQSGLAADTRAAVLAAGARWLLVDSSWYATHLRADIAAFRDELAITAPWLLDRDGAAAKALGAVATPQVVVVTGDGRIAYSGAISEVAPEDRRRNFVVDAVAALQRGDAVATPHTRPAGCSLAVGPAPAELPDFAKWEDAESLQHYRRAREHARAGEQVPCFRELRLAFDANLPWPARLLADPAFEDVLAGRDGRTQVRRLLADRPAPGVLRMVRPDEPGKPFLLCGTVRSSDGMPIEGAVVSLYQTDAAGWYRDGSTDGDDPRLFGRVSTDRGGRYRVRTIEPGRYAPDHDSPAHFHIGFRAQGHRPHEGHRASVYFVDDPTLVGEALAEMRGDGCAILPRGTNAEGVTICVYDVTLVRE